MAVSLFAGCEHFISVLIRKDESWSGAIHATIVAAVGSGVGGGFDELESHRFLIGGYTYSPPQAGQVQFTADCKILLGKPIFIEGGLEVYIPFAIDEGGETFGNFKRNFQRGFGFREVVFRGDKSVF